MVTEEVLTLARKVWDYHHMHHPMKEADCILALGSHDVRVAERAAELYLEGWAPLLIFSGGIGRLTEGWPETEAERFAKIALSRGVPQHAILLENKSTNTGENIIFTYELILEKQLNAQTFIVVQKPYMERRTYATVKKHWPDREIIIASPQIRFDEYPSPEIPIEQFINVMVGDLQRIKEYPAKGFQVYQHIPQEVWMAYEKLVDLGFNKQLIK